MFITETHILPIFSGLITPHFILILGGHVEHIHGEGVKGFISKIEGGDIRFWTGMIRFVGMIFSSYPFNLMSKIDNR